MGYIISFATILFILLLGGSGSENSKEKPLSPSGKGIEVATAEPEVVGGSFEALILLGLLRRRLKKSER